MSKNWKRFGMIIVVAAILLAIFDIAVLIHREIKWNEYVAVSQEAKKAGYTEDYTICTRQENVVIDGREYLCFNAHRHMILDGDYDENLLVSKEDQFEDMVPDEKENLEIFAKEIKRVKGDDGQDYTLIEVYRIDRCRPDFSGDWFWRALLITVIVMPVVCVSGIIWLIHFFVYKYKTKRG